LRRREKELKWCFRKKTGAIRDLPYREETQAAFRRSKPMFSVRRKTLGKNWAVVASDGADTRNGERLLIWAR